MSGSSSAAVRSADLAVGGFAGDRVARGFEHGACERAERVVVVHDQDAGHATMLA